LVSQPDPTGTVDDRRCAARSLQRYGARSRAASLPSSYTTSRDTTGLDVSEARRLKGLEEENRRLKKLLAEAMLDVSALKDVLAKNG
jgi:hypothetical protein